MTQLNNKRRSEASVLMCAQVDQRLQCALTGSGLILPCNSNYWIDLWYSTVADSLIVYQEDDLLLPQLKSSLVFCRKLSISCIWLHGYFPKLLSFSLNLNSESRKIHVQYLYTIIIAKTSRLFVFIMAVYYKSNIALVNKPTVILL